MKSPKKTTKISSPMQSNFKDIKLLPEKASGQDRLDDGTHDKVADAVADLVSGNSQAATLGLEGSWGAGKSTVIWLLKSKLQERSGDGTFFFNFDAWSHEGDNLRRAFLEKLLAQAVLEIPEEEDLSTDTKKSGKGKKCASSAAKEIKNVQKSIKGNSNSQIVRTVKKVSPFGVLTSVSAMFLTIGAALLSGIDFDEVRFPSPPFIGSIHWPLISAIGFTCFPFILILIWAVKYRKLKNTKWSFLNEEVETETIQDILENGDRTSVDFEIYFKRIIKAILSVRNRVIIVIDNLDRVSSNAFLSIWSTLQIFLLSDNSDFDRNRLWFIVPFDKVQLLRTLEDQLENTGAVSQQEDLGLSLESRSSRPGKLTEAFLSKNFQAIIEVPPPVISSWVSYCKLLASEALISWSDSDKNTVVNVFQDYSSTIYESPSPRSIRNYINQVAVLGIRYGEEIKVESIATYAYLRIKNTENELRSTLVNRLPFSRSSNPPSETMLRELSGMLFGVSPDKGLQLLLTSEIRTALNDCKPDHLRELISNYPVAFWVAWRVYENGEKISSSHSEECILTLTKSMSLGMIEHIDRISCTIDAIHTAVKESTGRWDLANFKYGEIIYHLERLLVARGNPEGLYRWILHSVDQSFDNRDKISTLLNSANGINQISRLADLASKDPDISIHDFKKFNLSVDNLKELENDPASKSLDIRLLAPPTSIDSYCQKILTYNIGNSLNMLPESGINFIRFALQTFPKLTDWINTINTVFKWAHSNHELGQPSAYELLLLLYFRVDKSEQNKLNRQFQAVLFWTLAKRESIDICPAIIPIYWEIYRNFNSSLSQHVPTSILQFWSNVNVREETIDTVIYLYQRLDMLDRIQEHARTGSNELAQYLLKKHQDIFDAAAVRT